MAKRKYKRNRKPANSVPRETKQYDTLASTYVIPDVNGELSEIAKLSNNLYNAALYQVRQRFFKKHRLMSYADLNALFKNKRDHYELALYGSFPFIQMAQQILKDVVGNMSNWLKALAAYYVAPSKFTGRPRICGYLEKGKRHLFHVTNQNAKIKDGYLIIKPRNGRMNFKMKVDPAITNDKLQRVTFIPMSNGLFKVIIQYKVNEQINYLPDNHKYMGIDPGVDNIFTCVTNTNTKPLIINGMNVVHVNNVYNYKIAALNSAHARFGQNSRIINTKQGEKTVYGFSRQQYLVTEKRNRLVHEFAHQATKRVLEFALSNDIHTIIIGHNRNWKRSVNMGADNNRKFVQLPHQQIIQMLKYKANLAGITVVETNESYTSQTSFLDGEAPVWRNGNKGRKKRNLSPQKRRITRSLFRSNSGRIINADVNGALQIIKKKVPLASFATGITGFVSNPVKRTVNI